MKYKFFQVIQDFFLGVHSFSPDMNCEYGFFCDLLEHIIMLYTYVGKDGDEREPLQDLVPDADVTSLVCRRPTPHRHELVGVQAHFDDVVEQRKERSERKRRHEDCHKTKLNHCNGK